MASRYNKELYDWYKANKICPQCGVNSATPNRVRCEKCLAKNAETAYRKRENVTPEQIENAKMQHRYYLKNLRQKRKSEGKCIYCGKPQSKNSTCMCIDCRIKNQRKNEKRRVGSISRSERPVYGMCYLCGSKGLMEGKKVCEKCYNSRMIGIEAARISPKTLERRRYIHRQNNLIFAGK